MNQKGFSLVEIMVALGMLGALSLGVMKINELMNKTSRNMNQQLDAVQIASLVQPYLRNTTACQLTFRGRTISSGATAVGASGILDSSGNTIINIGQDYGQVRIENITFENVQAASADISTIPNPNGTPNSYIDVRSRRAQVRVRMSKQLSTGNATVSRNATLGSMTIDKDFEMIFYVTSGATNTIETCYTASEQYVEASCEAFAGTLDTGLCRSIHVYDADGTPGPANSFAATFHGNVSIIGDGATNTNNRHLFVQGDIHSGRNLHAAGNTTLGDGLDPLGNPSINNDLTNVRGRMIVVGDFQSRRITNLGDGQTDTGLPSITSDITNVNGPLRAYGTVNAYRSVVLGDGLDDAGVTNINADVTTLNSQLRVNGLANFYNTSTFHTDVYLGNDNADYTYNRGRLCLTYTTGNGTQQCRTSWRSYWNGCYKISSGTNASTWSLRCNPGDFMVGSDRHSAGTGTWTTHHCCIVGAR